MGLFGRRKTQGRVFGAEKSPCGNGHTHSLVLGLFSRRKNPGVFFGGREKALREARGLTPWFWGRPGLEPGASRMRRPRANPLGNLCTIPMEGP